MRKKSFLALILILVTAISPFTSGTERITKEKPEITNSRMALLYEESTDTFLYDKDIDAVNAPASMTKVMTAMLVLEHNPELSGSAIVSKEAVSPRYCSWMADFHLLEGEEVSVAELMDYLLIVSANEAANVLAEHVSGDIDSFVQKMNEKAGELGMERTIYYDAHGLSRYSQITCRDMLKLCRYAMQNEKFVEIVSKEKGKLSSNDVRKSSYLYSSFNGVMFPKGIEEYITGFEEDIRGIKTGYIPESANNFSCQMRHEDLIFYGVVMHAHDVKNEKGKWIEYQFADMTSLFRWARSFKKAGFAAAEKIEGVMSTKLSFSKNIDAAPGEDLYILSQDEKPSYKVYPSEDVGLEVRKGQIVGSIVLADEFGNLKAADLIASSDAKTSIFPIITVIAVLVIGFAIVLMRVKKKRG